MRLTFEEFKKELLNIREFILPEKLKDAELSIDHVDKINHSYDALQIRMPGTDFAASIDLENFYKMHKSGSAEEAFVEFKEMLESMDIDLGQKLNSAIGNIGDYEQMKDKLFIRCSNADKNAALLQTCPHTQIGDIAFTVHIGIDWQEGTAPQYTSLVSDIMLDQWGVSKETLLKDAIENSANKLPLMSRPLSSVMAEISGFDDAGYENPDTAVYVLSNTYSVYGAAAVMYPGVLDDLQKKIGDFYMLPSSVHEFLLLPDKADIPVDGLERMVRDVNNTVLQEADFLSDHVFHYDGQEKVMEPARDYLQRMEVENNKNLGAAERTPEQGIAKNAMQERHVAGLRI